MGKVLNIHSKGEQIELEAGEYKIDVLGGWRVNLGEFSIAFKHNQSQQVVECHKAFWPIQTFKFDKRAKRIFLVKIRAAGSYTIKFNNPETIELKEKNLFFSSRFDNAVPSHKISIYIHQDYF